MNCVICGIRKARRACPGVRGEICTICCGAEREQSVDCPLDCEYLRQAHEHERKPEIEEDVLPDNGFVVDEDLIRRYEWMLMFIGSGIVDAYRAQPAITDFDVREALAALVKTYQTIESGLIYETRPANPYAAEICESVRLTVGRIQSRIAAQGQSARMPDSTVLGLLVFLRRLEYLENNGRKRSRAFLDVLNRSYIGLPETSPGGENVLEPEAPRIIL